MSPDYQASTVLKKKERKKKKKKKKERYFGQKTSIFSFPLHIIFYTVTCTEYNMYYQKSINNGNQL